LRLNHGMKHTMVCGRQGYTNTVESKQTSNATSSPDLQNMEVFMGARNKLVHFS
jgi:hypothetical protein